jgi:DNA invertase Pin-like site-specific DNA recombinase
MTGALRAAQYLRMSTEHQQYSSQNQMHTIELYANHHGMEIVQTYADHGRSGVTLAGRTGLQTLLADVVNKQTIFSVLLVYDVSRWGRFQDADESAYYEYVLKKAGIRIHYCTEQFVNDGSLPSVLFKTLKRTMAGEFSRELSAKVFAGQSRLIELGFRQGAAPGYGLRRQLVDKDRNPKALLATNERKSLQSDRVILVPGPEAETTIIAEIYSSFITLRKTETEIAASLNLKGLRTHRGQPWTRASVHRVLTGPEYRGMNVFNRRSYKLGTKVIRNPPEKWIICEHAFKQIVSTEDFQQAQAIINDRYRHWTDQKMLDGLRTVLETSGRLSRVLIDQATFLPSSATYFLRFGGLTRAYSLIGWHGNHGVLLKSRRALQSRRDDVIRSIVGEVEKCGATIRLSDGKGLFTVNDKFTVSIRVVRCHERPEGHRWKIDFARSQPPDVTLIARLEVGNKTILDYYVFRSIDILNKKNLCLEQCNPQTIDVYRFDTLESFLGLCNGAK